MAFWGQELGSNMVEPKRKYRWKVNIGGMGTEGMLWYAKTCDRPKMTISGDAEHKFLGHTFKFPGSVKWNDIETTLVDPISENAATRLLEILEKSGYVYPNENYVKEGDPRQRSFETISKGKATSALSHVCIYQLDADGNTVEAWKYGNRQPSVKQAKKIIKKTEGRLDYESIYGPISDLLSN